MLNNFQGIDKRELSMIEVAHAILEEKGSIIEFNELLVAVQNFLELSEDELEKKMSIFYTELNIDGSFISLGDNRWGLRSWYPIDSIDEELVSALEETVAPRKKRKKLSAFVTSEDDVDYSNDDPEDMDDLDDEDLLTSDDDDLGYRSDFDDLVDDTDEDSDDFDDAIEEDLTIVSDEDVFEEL
ncbi:DNA-directed RNA polymerase subunit delta [Granulicatella sp. zg-ZJ]|uniref:DNA-directed RNA polymerase subunit delta n=1 Tax=unclassified Granulicatella TaxID=2630493 RepID=UPI0013BF2842|nr:MULTISPECIES: DNA-directed RNA polymerase subunit delta [unclassified Granulicatella]MBS4750248.1 DNA-directed RNA polymerase subunit delta [Carnobacteriaceae bacterium zg-ZUI78]NEW62489.1 DNA-directed RNA polymerase subunit delta [Granulicatella sp. zg-ZJ]NEW66537.1 DNA-directed RNA polymerase subunit delta [Granulicatella sp. zg-84]QMI85813.1 DNA-directed RNA polymerase subunit delta [Carnobacteriaceae bacterium zg-84]